MWNERIDFYIEIGGIFGRARDNERGARLVDQNAIDLVNDCIIEWALYKITVSEFHIVAQVIKTEFVVGAIGNIGGVGLPTFIIVEAMHDAANRKAEEVIDAAHPR